LYLTDVDTGGIFSLDLRTGRRDPILDTAPWKPSGFGFDSANRSVFVLDDAGDQLLSVRLTGEVSLVSNDDSPLLGSSTGYGFIRGQVALEPDGESVLVTDSARLAIHRIDLATGARDFLVRTGELNGVESVVVDATGNRAIVSTGSLTDDGVRDAVVAFDLVSGERSVLANGSSTAFPVGSGVDLRFPVSLAVDVPNNAVLVFDGDLDAIVSIDLASLERRVLVDASTGNGDHLSRAFNRDNAFALDDEDRLVYAVNEEVGEVVMLDLVSGDQAVIAR
ncbi:MAG: hypothetical protein AAF658_11230, partial [Myxococcota bacterium]